MISAITLPNVNSIVESIRNGANWTVLTAKQTAATTIRNLTKPYTGILDEPIEAMYGSPAGATLCCEADSASEYRTKGGLGRMMRRMTSSRDLPVAKGLIDMSARGFSPAASTYTLCSNHVEASGSSSLTDSSEWTLWADDFQHSGL